MARGVFFSFHYDDVSEFRANVVRNSRALKTTGNPTTFIDQSLWEEAEKKSQSALKELINEGLKGSSVTAVLNGSGTANRKWVRYELVKSFIEGKGIVVVHINRIRQRSTGKITAKGRSPLDMLRVIVDDTCSKVYFQELKNGRWIDFKLLPSVNNRLKNSFYFDNGGVFRRSKAGDVYKFSELFDLEYCWVNDEGYKNFPDWIDDAAKQVGR